MELVISVRLRGYSHDVANPGIQYFGRCAEHFPMISASLQRVRDLTLRALIAGQAAFVLLIHVWLLTDPDIRAMSLLGSAIAQQSVLVNIVLIIGVSIVSGAGAIRQAYHDRYQIADLVTGCQNEKMLAVAIAPTRVSSLKNQHH